MVVEDYCDKCRCPIVESDVCHCGKAVKDHGEADGHTAVPLGTCMCGVPIDGLLQQLHTDLNGLDVRTRSERKVFDVLWLASVVMRRQQQEIESLKKLAQAYMDTAHDDSGVEEAYHSVRMCYQCMTRHRPSEPCAPWPKKGPFANTEPPPADKETTVFPPPPVVSSERQFPEEETNVALNVPCKHCGNFPETDETGAVWCTCPAHCDGDDDVPGAYTPREWVKENGDEGWRARGNRTRDDE